jgi:hypothetical protein
MAEYFQSEYEYGAMLADIVYESWAKNKMQINHHQLVGQMCREGFVLRLMTLLDIKLGSGPVTTPSPQGERHCLSK